ncbi:cobalamin biosynthesis protein [Halocatena halophila]|uniref:cobalamin biosynthesis protein n=1 Tax=Halocatena halophila TaxID=2814576 RepID=UPI002ED34413
MSDDSVVASFTTPTARTAYLWGHIIGNGSITDDAIVVRFSDRNLASRLQSIGNQPSSLSHETAANRSAHDATITRFEETFELRYSLGARAIDRLTDQLGIDAREEYVCPELERFELHRRQLCRGLLESCGTICFRESSATVGVSFVHDDRGVLQEIRRQLRMSEPTVLTNSIEESSSGGYWFGLADATEFGACTRWWYARSDDSGLYEPARRKKLRRSVERALERSVGELHGDPE